MANSISTNNDVQDFGSIQYKVIRNGGASKNAGKDVYTAQVVTKETYGTVQLADRMVAEGCLAKASTISLVLTDFANLVGKLVAEGRAVNIGGVVRFSPGIRGTFETADSAWDTAKNSIVVNAAAGNRMRTAAALSGVTRVDALELPILLHVMDVATGNGDTITSEGHFMVSGKRLTWDATADDEGWFINYQGIESKCTMVGEVQDPEGASLMATQAFDDAGDPIELFFRTRMGGEILHQIPYGNPLVTAVKA